MKFLKKFATRAEYKTYMASNESFPFVGYIKEEKAIEYTGAPAVTTIVIDQNLTDPALMISGDVNGDVIKSIRQQSHRYLGKYTSEGTMTLCQLDDSNSNFYADGATSVLTGAEGDVFMKMPQFYYKLEEVSPDKWAISFCETRLNAEWNEWNGNTLIGVYYSRINNSKMYSVSGVFPSGNQQSFSTLATNRGEGFVLADWQMHNVMAMLFYARYGMINSRNVIGTGGNNANIETGTCNAYGMQDTKGSNPVVGINDGGELANGTSLNFWGLEDWWGYYNQYIGKVSIAQDGTWNLTDSDGTTRAIQTTSSSGYVSKMLFGNKGDMIPIEVDGTGNTCFCSYYTYAKTSKGRPKRTGGVVGINASNNATSYDITGRLAFRGNCVIEPSSEAFKVLTAIA